MSRLKSITIRGFKSIREMTLDLRPLNVLIGANGSGKSNFIDAFYFLKELANENLRLHVATRGGANRVLYYGQKSTDKLFFHLDFETNPQNQSMAYSCTLAPSIDDLFTFAEEHAYWLDQNKNGNPHDFNLGSGFAETNLPRMAQFHDSIRQVKNAMTSWRIYHFQDTSASARVKQNGDLNDNRFLRPDASNLAAYLYRLKLTQSKHYTNIVDTIRLVAPFFDEFDLQPLALDEEKIRLQWTEKGSDAYFDAHSLSDGTLRFIGLATLLLQPTSLLPSIILLDEPELGLHPYAITVLADLLHSAAERTQLIVATQSASLINQFEPEDIIVVEREDRQSVFRRLSEEKIRSWLDDYSLGDLWEKNVLGGRPAA